MKALNKLGPFLGLIAVLILFSALRPKTFATFDNFQLILLQTAVVGIAAIGATLIIVSGGIDLSIGSNIALCTVVVAKLLNAGASPLVAGLGGIIMGGLCGVLISLLITKGKLTPFIVTLGAWGALRGAAKGLANETVVSAQPTWLNSLLRTPEQKWMLFPIGVWLMIILGVLVSAMLKYTRFGRHIFVIGSNEATARLCGIAVESRKILIYTLGLSFVGLAAVLQFGYLSMGDPTTANGYELSAIAAVVIGGGSLTGGQGSILGSLIGATIMTAIGNGCTKMDLQNWVQEIVTSVIIVLAVGLDRIRHKAALKA